MNRIEKLTDARLLTVVMVLSHSLTITSSLCLMCSHVCATAQAVSLSLFLFLSCCKGLFSEKKKFDGGVMHPLPHSLLLHIHHHVHVLVHVHVHA